MFKCQEVQEEGYNLMAAQPFTQFLVVRNIYVYSHTHKKFATGSILNYIISTFLCDRYSGVIGLQFSVGHLPWTLV